MVGCDILEGAFRRLYQVNICLISEIFHGPLKNKLTDTLIV